ncbi:IS21 family transposase [Mycobacterium intracellulare]|uniref:IS21 family transposase n=1 Tax=Mycobacterium intracellulare TaxID=1767 RepID=UPI001CD951E2|nr:IS21 family transposase [Mycobacterium intracellulare]MCA2249433.1 IS21 family transposase [Mycobacterium intracellulare]
MIAIEDWAEIRRLYRAEKIPIREIARRLGVARNTVRAALSSDRPPRYERAPRGCVVEVFEAQIRALLKEYPRMPATVIAERISWPYTMNPLRVRLREIRPEYAGLDPVDRFIYEPGVITQCDLWFPATQIPVGRGQGRVLPVLVMVLGFSRYIAATMLPSRQAGDLLSGMWMLISRMGRVTKTLVWDREAAIGGSGKVTVPAAAFAGTLATRIQLAPPRDPEFKGLVERVNGYLETSFLPGRVFASPADFNIQLGSWVERANSRVVRSVQGRPVELFETDYRSMLPLPRNAPLTGLTQRIRLARDYYIRVDTVDYSVDPRVIGRFVDVTASTMEVTVRCQGQTVARHVRSWAKHHTVTDPEHVAMAAHLRAGYAADRHRREHSRRHADGHPVALRALPDYDALFGVDFTVPATETSQR